MVQVKNAELVNKPLAAIVLVNGNGVGFQSAIYSGRGASGALYIQGVVDLLGLGE